MGDAVSLADKPLAAAKCVPPTLQRYTPNVVTGEQVVGPFFIGQYQRICGARFVPRAAVAEFFFVALAAVRAVNF
ncbi:hypothetical protein D3C80_1644720 [compost metagenome]